MNFLSFRRTKVRRNDRKFAATKEMKSFYDAIKLEQTMTDTIIVVTTFEDKEEALSLGRHLLEKRLIACAQVSGAIDSQYWWQGHVEQAQEYRLEMKSSRFLWEELEKEIQKSHSYETPEIVVTAVSAISNNYQKWLLEELQQ